jgi:phosphatidylethanolamine/phosphatidyl-N-methylethanolamine N-methyltransferase
MGRAANYRLFWREFRRTFYSTGAVLPSGPALCRALASQVPGNGSPRRLLEVGPGTGVVTDQIIRRMGPDDSLDVVELNDRFVSALNKRLTTDPHWRAAAARVQIHHLPIEELPVKHQFQAIVSGLPLNNFPVESVRNILSQLRSLAAPGGTLSFFEYVGVRKAKALLCSRAERQRLAGIGEVLHSALDAWSFDRQRVVSNVPPAWVHHLRF